MTFKEPGVIFKKAFVASWTQNFTFLIKLNYLMKVLNLFLVTLLCCTKMCLGQSQPQTDAGIDIGVGANSSGTSPSVLYYEEVGLPRMNWFQVGIGIRTWGFYSGKADLTLRHQSQPEQILKYQKLSANGLGFITGLNFKISRVDVGANTDIIGLVCGSARRALYVQNTNVSGEGAAYYNKLIQTAPTVLNVLPFFLSRQTGQSEIYARIKITRSFGVKVGYLHGRLAYKTMDIDDKKVVLDYGQQKFSKTYGMPYAAFCYSFSD